MSNLRKRVLVISPTPSHPQNAGNRARVYSLLSNIRQMGHDLYFLHIGMERGGSEQLMRSCWGDRFYSVPYAGGTSPDLQWKVRRLFNKELAFAYTIDRWYDASLDAFLQRLLATVDFDVVIVEYVFLSKALECFDTGVLKIIDTLDVFTNRHRRFLQHGQLPSWFSTTARQEAKGLNRSDLVVAIQGKDEKALAKLTKRRVVTVGHIVPTHEPATGGCQKGRIVFIGSAHAMNVHGINWFIGEVLPKVKTRYPTVELTVVGQVCNALEDFDGCVKLGEVEDIADVYEMADVVVNPVPFGTGLKIKTIEALGFAKPLVTTPAGAEGLEDIAADAFLVAHSPEEFAASIMEVFGDPELSNSLTSNAYSFASSWNQRNVEALAELLA